MNESSGFDGVVTELMEKYGKERVVVEPTLSEAETFYPDIAVFADTEQTIPFLIVEYSNLKTPHRRSEDVDQVKKMMEESGAPYGAVASEDLNYVFTIGVDEEAIEISVSGYPDIDQTGSGSKKPIESVSEFKFLLDRVRDSTFQKASSEYLQHLYRKYEADRISVNIRLEENIEGQVRELDESIQRRHESYQPEAAPRDSELLQAIFTVFSGHNLASTDKSVLQDIVDEIIQGDRFDTQSGQYSTPHVVADGLLELTDVKAGETLLDPAAGWGYIPRAASKRGGEAYGVEIVVDALNSGLFLSDLLGIDVSYIPGDFLQMSLAGDSSVPDSVDCVAMDPPLGNLQDRDLAEQILNGEPRLYEEAFIVRALTHLSEGGRLVSVVSTSVLSSQRSSWFRDFLTSDYAIRGIVELGKSRLFPFSYASRAIVVIENSRQSDYSVPASVVDTDADVEEELEKAVQRVKSEQADRIDISDPDESFLPSEQIGMREAEAKLKERFSDVAPIEEVAFQVTSGTHYSQEEIEEGDGDYPFLRLRAEIENRYVSVEDDSAIAGETDLLVSIKGQIGKTYIPERPVVPSSNWAILRFESTAAAKVYGSYFGDGPGLDQLEALSQGSSVQYVPLRRLHEVLVPIYDRKQLRDIARQIQEIEDRLDETREFREEIREELKEVF